MARKSNRKKVLIIEDEELMLETLNDKFKSEGYQTLAAKNGEEGIKNALINHPDLIILDIVMPKMDGLTALKEMKKDSWGQTVPVIILTNISETEKLAEALEIGVVEYLLKTEVTLDDIIKKSNRVLKI